MIVVSFVFDMSISVAYIDFFVSTCFSLSHIGIYSKNS